MDETDKQKKFAYYWAITRNPEEAARICGEPHRWCEWIGNKYVQREMQKLQRAFRKESPGEIAKRGLERIVFGMAEIHDKEDKTHKEDKDDTQIIGGGFQIAEWKQPKGGGHEVKFWDKLKALELLIRLEEQCGKRKSQTETAVYQALESGARALKGWEEISESNNSGSSDTNTNFS